MTAPAAVSLGAQLRSARAPADKAAARPVARCTRLVVRAGVGKETDPKKRIVITGMGIASVFGNDPDTFYDALLAGKSGISLIDRFDTTDYPTRFAGQIKNFECVQTQGSSVGGGLSRGCWGPSAGRGCVLYPSNPGRWFWVIPPWIAHPEPPPRRGLLHLTPCASVVP